MHTSYISTQNSIYFPCSAQIELYKPKLELIVNYYFHPSTQEKPASTVNFANILNSEYFTYEAVSFLCIN